MLYHRLLSATALIALLVAAPAMAQENAAMSAFKPRIEGSLRAGTERSIAVTEIWVPLAQDYDRVLYGDVRYMGDDQDNREGNVGIGYRQMTGDRIYGGHAWIDRRETENDSLFYQTTLGTEIIGKNVEFRGNVYIPLSDSRTFPASGGNSDPFLAGSGIFVQTPDLLTEEPQKGLDLELGVRIPVFTQNVDSIRAYGGGYAFRGDESEDVTGLRTRVSVDINPAVSVGARYQHDDVRGSQTFLEATIRFPGKKSFRQDGLRARMDESPERDIDIVTGSKKAPGVIAPVLNVESGQAQRVLYVDNNAASGGTGTIDNPYNDMAAAQSNIADHDVLYIKSGSGQYDALTVNARENIQIIGEGSDFIYDTGRFTVGNGFNASATLLRAAGVAPVISGAGDGISIQDSNWVMISGVDVNGAGGNGIYALRSGNLHIQDVTLTGNAQSGLTIDTNGVGGGSLVLRDIVANGNDVHGINVIADAAAIDDINLQNVTANNNTTRGVTISTANAGSSIGAINAATVTTNNNGTQGFLIQAQDGTIGDMAVREMRATQNGQEGIDFLNLNTTMGNIIAHDVQSNNNIGDGFLVVSANGAVNGNITIADSVISDNQHGFKLQTSAGGSVGDILIQNLTANNNIYEGIQVVATGKTLGDVHILNAETNDGVQRFGTWVYALNGGLIGNVMIDALTVARNNEYGLEIWANNGTITHVAVQNSDIYQNGYNNMDLFEENGGVIGGVDLGGGGTSIGNNRLYGGSGGDIELNIGELVTARNNWWGSAAGLNPIRAAIVPSVPATSLDASQPLTTDPRP